MREDEVAALDAAIADLWGIARDEGLDPMRTHFELVPAPVLYEVAAYGLPGRFAHWSHGKAYQQMKTQYDFGLMKIFELIIHADPAQAFLLDTNDLFTNKFVAAHVLGHSDFFKHNAYFRRSSLDMDERVRLHAERIRAYEFAHGRREVEAYLDAILAIQEHVDPWADDLAPLVGVGVTRPQGPEPAPATPNPWEDLMGRRAAPTPPPPKPSLSPEVGEDLLLVILRHAPDLEDWQRDVIALVRTESLYFRPYVRTKIMNEGWATFWHVRLLRRLQLDDAEYTEFARLNAGVRSPYPGAVNPYLLGVSIWEDLCKREGLQRCFLVRESEDDLSFLRNHLTKEVAKDLDVYVYQFHDDAWSVTDKAWDKVHDALIQSRVHCGHPRIVATDIDHRGARELYLVHRHDGRELDLEYADRTLQRVAQLWRRRVHLETLADGKPKVLSCDPPAK
ncbi:MAG TPA: SpoVR family protein [Bacillota bacterium]|nr:SpoVR family protein [Bacillota bacterium]